MTSFGAQTAAPEAHASTPAVDKAAEAYYQFVLGHSFEGAGQIDKAIAAYQSGKTVTSTLAARSEGFEPPTF